VKVWIKNLEVEMQVKNNGIELDIRDNADKHIGDLYVTKTKLIWCKGRINRDNGKEFALEDFIAMMDAR
jgi:hypothetical protein